MLISKSSTSKKTHFRRNLYILSISLIIGFFLIFLFKEEIYKKIYGDIVLRTHIKSIGIGGIDRDVSPASVLKDLGKNIFNLNSEAQKIDNIIIDIKFKDIQKLNLNRANALEDGMIDRTHFESVSAKLRLGKKKYKARIRLKGYFLDHLATDKWSLKIKVKGTHLDGMRDFTINAPHTRDFHSSLLINDAMRFKGILAQKDGFYNVIINGKNIGIMYFEERYTENFTERAKKPFGPILNFDEKSKKYSFVDENKFWINDQNLRIAASHIESLIDEPEKNISLINQDVWAEYLAITFLFKCFHGNVGINLSHYFHPIDKKFQPISSDNSCGQKENGRELGFLPYEDEFIYKLISIDSFKEKLIKKLEWWDKSDEGAEFILAINNKERVLRRTLANESPFLQEFIVDTSHISEILKWINNLKRSEFPIKLTDQFSNLKGKKIPQITITRDNQKLILSANEYSKERYKLDTLIIKYPNKNKVIKLGNDFSEKEITKAINDFHSGNADIISGISYRFEDSYRNKNHEIGVNLFYIQENFNPFKNSDLTNILKYFSLDESTKKLFIEDGKIITIQDTLIIPEDYSLTLNEGSVLNFEDNTGLVIKGGLNVYGSNEKKVTLQGHSSKNWSGILVLGNGKDLTINNVKVIGGNGVFNGIPFRGSFTIHNSYVNINNSIFTENLSEDALNLVEIKAFLNNITISNTKSDGLDVDYGDIKLVNSNFINIGSASGADAVDVSKTNLSLESSYFNNITDKGISVGENSTATILNTNITKAFVGVVAKDSSKIIMSNVKLDAIGFADTMAYRKKSHFNGAEIRGIDIEPFLNNHLVQTNSSSIINGEAIKPENIDIDILYDTVMESIK